MHLKSPTTTPAPTTTANSVANENRKNTQNSRTMMAATTSNSLSEDNGGGGSGNRINSNNNNNNNNSHSNEDNVSSNTAQMDEAEVKLKKQTLEQRKLELERLLSEKSWLLQQIQKQETQILNGNYEYLNAKEIFAMLALQYKQEHGTGSGGGGVEGSGTSAILRRKTVGSKENNNNNNNNRQSEISNRSSEYDNYPASGGGGGELNAGSVAGGEVSAGGSVVHMTAQQQTAKTALKKRATPTPTPTMANLNYNQAQRQQMLHQQMLQTNLQYAALLQHPHYHQQQQQQLYQQHQQQQQQLLYQQQQQQQSPQQRHYQTDAISLYSMNSTNVATLRQQHVAPQQQPIVVQCDRYYLSPTHQSYHDGGFIKSSQNIKKYVSPMASPTTQHPHQHHPHELLLEENDALLPPQHPQHLTPSQQKLQRMLWYHYQQQEHASSRQLDAISLAPSYISVDAETHSMRWRSQSNLPPAPHAASHAGSTLAGHSNQDVKSHSSDMLANNAYYTSTNPSPHLKPKPLDEISISSLNSETQKAKPSKPKQWLESSLDGPVMRTQSVPATHATMEVFQNTSTSVRLPPSKAHVAAAAPAGNGGGAARERAKLSSQSMSSARHYSMSSHKHPLHSKLLADDDGRYAKLSQSTSYLNSMEPMVPSSSISAAYHLDVTPTNTCIDLPPTPVLFAYLPPKPGAAASVAAQFTPPPPPRPPPANEKVATTPAPLSPPDIRIESPKNMTVVQQATFQPYKEETKPFEMSDFYKYSTKFRQKEASVSTANVD